MKDLMTTCTRRLTFEAGHRVYGHENKCANMHGHSYKVEVSARQVAPWSITKPGFREEITGLDAVGRVIDFSVLKEKVGGWIDRHWDHAFICYEKDEQLKEFFTFDQFDDAPPVGNKHWVLHSNPTAENLALYLLTYVCPLVLEGTNVEVYRVILYETENCWATAKLLPLAGE